MAEERRQCMRQTDRRDEQPDLLKMHRYWYCVGRSTTLFPVGCSPAFVQFQFLWLSFASASLVDLYLCFFFLYIFLFSLSKPFLLYFFLSFFLSLFFFSGKRTLMFPNKQGRDRGTVSMDVCCVYLSAEI